MRRFRWYVLNRNAVHPQRLVRGFLARVICKRLVTLRNALREWVNPRYAHEFMKKFLASKAKVGLGDVDGAMAGVDRETLSRAVSAASSKARIAANEARSRPTTSRSELATPAVGTVRSFLPRDLQKDKEVRESDFHEALKGWYRQDDSPLLASEFEAIVRRFRNNQSGCIHVDHVDAYIEMHEKPCRKHGRKVGGRGYPRRARLSNGTLVLCGPCRRPFYAFFSWFDRGEAI